MVMKVTFVHLEARDLRYSYRTLKNHQSQITMKSKVWMKDCYRNKR